MVDVPGANESHEYSLTLNVLSNARTIDIPSLYRYIIILYIQVYNNLHGHRVVQRPECEVCKKIFLFFDSSIKDLNIFKELFDPESVRRRKFKKLYNVIGMLSYWRRRKKFKKEKKHQKSSRTHETSYRGDRRNWMNTRETVKKIAPMLDRTESAQLL